MSREIHCKGPYPPTEPNHTRNGAAEIIWLIYGGRVRECVQNSTVESSRVLSDQVS